MKSGIGSNDAELRALVRDRYGEAGRRAASGERATCCGNDGSCGDGSADPITGNLYDPEGLDGVPDAAVSASLGCGNPTALAELSEGEVVLDLGSGGGIDVLLSAERVGPGGKAYGLDMTPEMLELARENARKAGATNVEFLEGEIESIPLPDESVDVIISNCVVNLSADKHRALAEAYRVLKPGGRFAVSDVVVRGSIPAALRREAELWIGCVAGALEETEFETLLREVGFEEPSLEPTRIYDPEDARAVLENAGVDGSRVRELEGRFMAAFVRATKPTGTASAQDDGGTQGISSEERETTSSAAEPCCAPSCCS